MDDFVGLIIIVLVGIALVCGYKVGRLAEAGSREGAACIEQCKPKAAVYDGEKCGCMP